jgi:hypothetical protein
MSIIFTLFWLAVAVLGLGAYCSKRINEYVLSKFDFWGQPDQAVWLFSALGIVALVHVFGALVGIAIVLAAFFFTNRSAWGKVKDAASRKASNLKSRFTK